MIHISPPRNLWQCNLCDAIRSAKCGPVCLPGDHYDPRERREQAAIQETTHE